MTREEYLEYLRQHHEDRSEAEQAFHAAYNDAHPVVMNSPSDEE